MNAAFRLLFFTVLLGAAANADTLKLRNGEVVNGEFLGATDTAVWFHSDYPDGTGTAQSYPILYVESLTFGPAGRQTSAMADPQDASLTAKAASSQPAPKPKRSTKRGKP